MKIATNTNSTLIITAGTNTGITKYIGASIIEHNVDRKKVSLLGIANWGRIANKDELEVKYFIFVSFIKCFKILA